MSLENYDIEEIEGFLKWKLEEFDKFHFHVFSRRLLNKKKLNKLISSIIGEINEDYKKLLEGEIFLDEFNKRFEKKAGYSIEFLPIDITDYNNARKEMRAGREVAKEERLENFMVYYFPKIREKIIEKSHSKEEYEERLMSQFFQYAERAKNLSKNRFNQSDYEEFSNFLDNVAFKRLKRYISRKKQIF